MALTTTGRRLSRPMGSTMSDLLDAAKRLADVDPAESESGQCIACGGYLYPPHGHAPDCPWLAMPKIVEALEAAGDLVEAIDEDGPTDNIGRKLICRACVVDLVVGHHSPDCPWRQMLDALKGQPLPTNDG